MKKLYDDYTLEQIEEYGECRVWLHRMTVDDGAECDNLATVERLLDGRWQTVTEYQARDVVWVRFRRGTSTD